jgi:DNA (cytosine-5)-methyltransferase 1
MSARPKFVSLFSGCGGFDQGFIQAGFDCIAAYDIDPYAVETHNANLKYEAKVCDLSENFEPPSELKGIDVVLAGPPCQGFSTAGKRKIDDPRNELLLIAGNIAIKIRPKIFVAENVRGVIAGKHKVYWETLQNLLISHGYKTLEYCCLATQIGLAQIRKRMILIAYRSKYEFNFNCNQAKAKVLRDVLLNLEKSPNHDKCFLPDNSDDLAISKNIKPSQKLCNVRGGPHSIHTWEIPEVFGSTDSNEREILTAIMKIRRRRRVRNFGDADPVPLDVLEKIFGRKILRILNRLRSKGYVRIKDGAYDLTNTFNGKYRRLSWDEPSLTVDTRFGDPKYFLHPSENRGFTVREAARIQGFPDTFVFLGKLTEQYKVIGNAVPPPIGNHLAEAIKPLIRRID